MPVSTQSQPSPPSYQESQNHPRIVSLVDGLNPNILCQVESQISALSTSPSSCSTTLSSTPSYHTGVTPVNVTVTTPTTNTAKRFKFLRKKHRQPSPTIPPSFFQSQNLTTTSTSTTSTSTTTNSSSNIKTQWKKMKAALASKSWFPESEEDRKRWKSNLEFVGYIIIGTLTIALFVICIASLIILI